MAGLLDGGSDSISNEGATVLLDERGKLRRSKQCSYRWQLMKCCQTTWVWVFH